MDIYLYLITIKNSCYDLQGSSSLQLNLTDVVNITTVFIIIPLNYLRIFLSFQ